MIDAIMLEVRNIQHVVARQTVTINHAIGLYFSLDNGHQSLGLRIGNDLGVNLATALEKPKCRDFSGSTSASLSFAFPAKVAPVNIYLCQTVIGLQGGYESTS